MKQQALFSLKDKNEKIKCHLLQSLFGFKGYHILLFTQISMKHNLFNLHIFFSFFSRTRL